MSEALSVSRIRVATWNLERCPSTRRSLAAAQQQRLAEVDADIWVLTESFVDRSPGSDFKGVHCPPHDTKRSGPNERYTSIWSRWHIEPITDPAPNRRGTVAALVDTPLGSVVVYGTVIPYGNERQHDDDRPANPWEVHLAEIERQSAEWRAIRERHPDLPLIVAGDFNQARSGRPRSYGTAEVRQALSRSLESAGLTCLTEDDFVVTEQIERSHVEHICASHELSPVSAAMIWDRADRDGRRLSDHPTLAIDLTTRADSSPIGTT